MRVFERVAGLQNFSAAARELGMTISMVSRLVAELEDDLGVRLLNRTTRKMNLTEAGSIYLERIRDILSDIEELNQATRNLHQAPSGRLRVTCAEWIAHSRIFELMPRFMKKFPDVQVDLEVSNRVVDLIQEGFDVALRFGRLSSSSLIARKVYLSNSVMCATPAYCDVWGAPVTPSDLSNHNCMLYSSVDGMAHWRLSKDGTQHRVPVSGDYTVNTAGGLIEAVRAGRGIGVLPLHDVRAEIASGRLIRLMPDYQLPSDALHAVYAHRKHLSAKVRAFVDFVAEELDEQKGPVSGGDRKD